MRQRIWTAGLVICSLLTFGCSDGGGLERLDLYGKITYKNQPVPAGSISFRPDRKKGGSGPAGFAKIVEGEYSTSSSGKGAVSGPVVVMIEGAVDNKPMSAALFPAYRTTIDVSDDAYEFDFEVPEAEQRKPKRNARR